MEDRIRAGDRVMVNCPDSNGPGRKLRVNGGWVVVSATRHFVTCKSAKSSYTVQFPSDWIETLRATSG